MIFIRIPPKLGSGRDSAMAVNQSEIWTAQVVVLTRCPPGHADALLTAVADRSLALTLTNSTSTCETIGFLTQRTLERLDAGYSLIAALAALPQTLGDLGAQKILFAIGDTNPLSGDELKAIQRSAITVKVRRG
jgi:hypothetical protein